jgi:hypothetical protein
MQELFNSCSLYGNTDSSYGDEKDHCWSTMGQILMLNGGPVHQKSYEYKAQIKEAGETLGEASVMTSTVQAEYVALSNGAREQMEFSELLDFFRESIEDTTSYGLEGRGQRKLQSRIAVTWLRTINMRIILLLSRSLVAMKEVSALQRKER